MPFLILFVILTLLELVVFGVAIDAIGFWATLGLAFLTAIIGGTLVKRQGLQTLIAMRIAMNSGKIPLDEIFDGFCLVFAGAFLITPGFITDTIGFVLLLPLLRKSLRHVISKYTNLAMGTSAPHDAYKNTDNTASQRDVPDVIEGEYEQIDETDKT